MSYINFGYCKDQYKLHLLFEAYYGKHNVIAYANSKGSGKPAHLCSLTRSCAVKR